MANSLKPLVKWSGGKSDELANILPHIPTDYDTYLEPFVGGGAVYFHVAPKKAVLSDVHVELIDLYRAMHDGSAPVIREFMASHPNDEETYYQVRDKMEIASPLDNACRFYYLRKTCYRGMLRYNKSGKFNIPFGRYKTLNYTDLEDPRYTALLGQADIRLDTFETIFREYNDPANFMFLDPPYDSEFTDYGYCQFGRAEHETLAKCFKETRIRCLMVIGRTDFIADLYRDYIVAEYPKQYRFKLHSGRVGSEINTSHLVIKNY